MDLVHARCAHEGCITSPSYGSAADGRYARFFPRRSWLLLTASGTPIIPCGFPCPKRGNVMGSPAGPLPHVAPDILTRSVCAGESIAFFTRRVTTSR